MHALNWGTVFKSKQGQRYCQGRLSESDSDSAADLLQVQGGSSMSAQARTGPQAPLQRRIAVVGSGISGLSAAWLLHRCACVQLISNTAAKPCQCLAILASYKACCMLMHWQVGQQLMANVPQYDYAMSDRIPHWGSASSLVSILSSNWQWGQHDELQVTCNCAGAAHA